MTVRPLEGPNAGWTINELSDTFHKYGPPKHMITDQDSIFNSTAFRDFLEAWGVKIRYGAVGKKGSIAVTERINKTLKYEWLKRVPLIRGFDHLQALCTGFGEWYNEWRPHMRLSGFRPDDYYQRNLPEPVSHGAKTIPPNIEQKVFRETRVVGYRLKEAA